MFPSRLKQGAGTLASTLFPDTHTAPAPHMIIRQGRDCCSGSGQTYPWDAMGWQGPCVPRWHLLHWVGTGEGGGLRDGVELGVDCEAAAQGTSVAHALHTHCTRHYASCPEPTKHGPRRPQAVGQHAAPLASRTPSDGLSLGEGDTDGVTDMLDVTDTVGDGEGVMNLVAVGVGQQRLHTHAHTRTHTHTHTRVHAHKYARVDRRWTVPALARLKMWTARPCTHP